MPTKPAGPCRDSKCPYRAVERGWCATHAAKHPPKPRPVDDRPSAAKRGYDQKWRRIRAHFLKFKQMCAECGTTATEVDHIKPLAAGGTHKWENLRPLCKPCHSRKTSTQDGGFGRRS